MLGLKRSRLYSERVYVLARGFLKHALSHPLSGLEGELYQIYIIKGRLGKVIDDGEKLIASSRAMASLTTSALGSSDQSIERLTLGGILPLERILTQLGSLLVSRSAAPSP
jgi:ubiquitin-conjugating enzyme E2 O